MVKQLSILDGLKQLNIESVDAGYRKFVFNIKKTITHKGDSCWGLTDFHDATIELAQDMKPETAREVLLHEITHVVLELVGLGGDEEDAVTVMTNEEITTLISRGFLLLINLNPELFTLLLTPTENICEMTGEEGKKA